MLLGRNGKKLAASNPVTGEPKDWVWEYATCTAVTDRRVMWAGGRDLAAVRGKKIRLKFSLGRAKLYSFSFSG